MDPITILFLIFTIFISTATLKTFQYSLSRPKTPKAIVPKASEDYDARWNDPEYVAMVHATRLTETDVLGEAKTVCECKACTMPPTGCGFMGCGASGCENHCSGKADLPKAKTVEPGPRVVYNYFNLNGYEFKIRSDQVPANAHGSWDHRMQIGVFKWIDSATGYTMMVKALPDMEITMDSYSVYSDMYHKPVGTFKPKRNPVGSRSGKTCSVKECRYICSGENLYCYRHKGIQTMLRANTITGSRITTNSTRRRGGFTDADQKFLEHKILENKMFTANEKRYLMLDRNNNDRY